MAPYNFHLLNGRKLLEFWKSFFFLKPTASRSLEAKDVEVPWNYHGDEAQSTSHSELTFLLKDLNLELMFGDAIRFASESLGTLSLYIE